MEIQKKRREEKNTYTNLHYKRESLTYFLIYCGIYRQKGLREDETRPHSKIDAWLSYRVVEMRRVFVAKLGT